MELKDKDLELIERGTRALINELGYSGFLKYISRIQMFNGNYFRAQEVVYKGIAADEDYKESNR